MKATVVKRVSFDAAHYLPHYDGKCKNLHGHHWLVELAVNGTVDRETGMVIDFTILKDFLKREVVDKFDHHHVNNTITNPTAENIAAYILGRWNDQSGYTPKLEFIRVWETEDSYAEVRA